MLECSHRQRWPSGTSLGGFRLPSFDTRSVLAQGHSTWRVGLKVSAARKESVLSNLIPLLAMCLMVKAGITIDFLSGEMCPPFRDEGSARELRHKGQDWVRPT